jgi:MAF protein
MWNNNICLASSSPRRREMFAWIGLSFKHLSTDINEEAWRGELPVEYVMRLAQQKAQKGREKLTEKSLVVAADTIVALDGEMLGKPEDTLAAENMLRKLRGRIHQVITALCVIDVQSDTSYQDHCLTQVEMRLYSDEEIRAYIESGDPLDKAGAYAIQHRIFKPVVNFNGCFASVMGLPLCHLERTFRKIDGYPKRDMPEICKNNVGYTCPIFQQVLAGEEIG